MLRLLMNILSSGILSRGSYFWVKYVNCRHLSWRTVISSVNIAAYLKDQEQCWILMSSINWCANQTCVYFKLISRVWLYLSISFTKIEPTWSVLEYWPNCGVTRTRLFEKSLFLEKSIKNKHLSKIIISTCY